MSACRLAGPLLALLLSMLSACTSLPAAAPGAASAGSNAVPAAPVVRVSPPPTSATPPAPPPVADLSVLRPPVRARYRDHQGSAGQVYLIDPARSEIRIYAFRAGTAARFGHNHVLTVPRFSGLAWAPGKGLRGGTADLGFRLADVTVDPPALRAETGGAFATPLDEEAVRGTYEHLVGAQGFDAASHPWIEIGVSVETGEVPVAIADVALTLHGQTHHQRVMLRVQADERRLEVEGQLTFRQGDYGLQPYAVMGGLLAVDDLVAVDFHLRGAPLTAPIP